MALAADTPITLANTNNIPVAQYDQAGFIMAFYRDIVASKLYVQRIIATTFAVQTRAEAFATAATYPDLARISDGKHVAILSDGTTANKAAIITSGNPPTVSSWTDIETGSTSYNTITAMTSSTALAAWYKGGLQLATMDVSGATVTSVSTVSPGGSSRPQCLIKLTSTTALLCYQNIGGGLWIVGVDTLSGISLGTAVSLNTSSSGPAMELQGMVLLSTDKAIGGYHDATTNYLRVFNISSRTTIALGTEFSDTGTNIGKDISVDRIRSSQIIAAYKRANDGSSHSVGTFSIDVSDIITADGDNVDADGNDVDYNAIFITSSGEALLTYRQDSDSKGYANKITSVPSTSTYGIVHSAGGIPGSII